MSDRLGNKKRKDLAAVSNEGNKKKTKSTSHSAATSDIDDIFGCVKKPISSDSESRDSKKKLAADDAAEKSKKGKSVKGEMMSHDKVVKADVAEKNIGSSLPHGVVKSNAPRLIISPDPPVERIDPESGFKVYKAHLLKVGEGGGTPLCPFDCDCCF